MGRLLELSGQVDPSAVQDLVPPPPPAVAVARVVHPRLTYQGLLA